MENASKAVKMINPMATITCDQCRARKVRCIPGPQRRDGDSNEKRDTANTATSPSSPSSSTASGAVASPEATTQQSRGQCKNCSRRREKCTYVYMPKKPGRPRAPPSQRRTQQESSPSPRDSSASASPSDPTPPADMGLGLGASTPLGPAIGSIFGSARQTLQNIEFDYTLPPGSRTRESSARPEQQPAQSSDELSLDVASASVTAIPSMFNFALDDQADRTVYTPSTMVADLVGASEAVGRYEMGIASSCSGTGSVGTTTHTNGREGDTGPKDAPIDISRIQNFASWEDVGFFLSLHMKHQHMLVPLVHWPSFAQDVLHRRDEVDESFRGLLLSMVAYTICQCPINWLVGRMDKAELEALLARCQRGSRMIQIRHQTRPSLVVLASTILDWITSQSASPAELPAALMSDVRRLIYTLGLNREMPKEGLSPLELQLCRNLYWEAYAIDKTNALNGHPVNLHDMDGVPPLPLEVDDEFLSVDGGVQPSGRLSYMAGFAYLARLFKVLSGCIVRHRTLAADPSSVPDKSKLMRWVTTSLEDVQSLLAQLPEELQPENISHDGPPSVFGTQAANLYVTALCIELSLLDLRAKLVPEEDTETARAEIAQRAFRQLEHMPLECLASNGESMRGKVLRVILALLGVGQEGGTLSDGLWDWWNMYSRVQFIQLLPEIRV